MDFIGSEFYYFGLAHVGEASAAVVEPDDPDRCTSIYGSSRPAVTLYRPQQHDWDMGFEAAAT